MRPLIVWLLSAACFGQVPTAPATTEAIRPADDFATQAFQDPWDMSQRTDIGWFTFGVDSPPSNLQSPTVASGIFSAVSANADPNFWALDTGHLDAAPTNKNGEKFPIDASKYKRLLIRMNLNGPGLSSATPASLQTLWWNNTLYQAGGPSVTPGYLVRPGWWIYSIDLTAPASAGPNWAGIVDAMRIDPVNLAGITMNVDWVRLVADNPALSRNITWTGGGAVDIFLDNDTNWANGYLAQIATGATGGSYPFYVGGLPVGTYHVAIRATGSAATPAYAPGSYQVEDIPTISFTAPSPTGSSDDFATVQLGNPWDMDTLADVDNFIDVTGPSITNITAENEAGASLGSVRVLQGTSVQAPGDVGDPRLYMLQWTHRGATKRIDSSRYRILDLEMGVTGARDIFRGSIARIIWRAVGDPVENVSEDIILNHLDGTNVIQKIVLDMKALPIEATSPSHTGWNGLLDGFRVDPHEFPEPRTFYVKSVYLRAFERTDASYTIRWNYGTAGTSGSPALTLFYDSDNTGFNGTPIATVTDPATGAYTWNTAALPAGTYYIYGVVSAGGTILNRTYAQWPVVIEHGGGGSGATLSLDRSQVRFGATTGGASITGPQEVQITVTGGAGTWTATANQPWITVSPTSGTGSGKFTVSLNQGALPATGASNGMVTVTVPGAINSPQTIAVSLNVMNPAVTAAPIGVVDTPANGATNLSGAIGVTGWALDDTEVIRISLWRGRIGSEPVAANGLVFIGDAVFLEGARPDVANAYPNYPLNTRGGWGVQVLTNMLPNSNGSPGTGNGTYKLSVFAHDREGKTTLLGSPTVTVNNAAATRPFGTLDTPGNGETVSGLVTVFGWALTPQPATIPTDGSTIWVFVDGISMGHPVYNQFRPDIATLFPGYNNSSGAVGYFYLDTTTLSNGLHSIAWSVTDNMGRIEGIGNRLFWVRN
jgi:hypothetical protein